jgi:uncharacterized membrane protein
VLASFMASAVEFVEADHRARGRRGARLAPAWLGAVARLALLAALVLALGIA